MRRNSKTAFVGGLGLLTFAVGCSQLKIDMPDAVSGASQRNDAAASVADAPQGAPGTGGTAGGTSISGTGGSAPQGGPGGSGGNGGSPPPAPMCNSGPPPCPRPR